MATRKKEEGKQQNIILLRNQPHLPHERKEKVTSHLLVLRKGVWRRMRPLQSKLLKAAFDVTPFGEERSSYWKRISDAELKAEYPWADIYWLCRADDEDRPLPFVELFIAGLFKIPLLDLEPPKPVVVDPFVIG
jgi:hypothetical protein